MLSCGCWASEGYLELHNGYFWDAASGRYFIPHGVAYQCWNPPVYANQTTNQVEYDLREMKRMHVNSLRVEFTWSQIETNEGCYHFANADFLIELAEKLDMKLFILMGYQYPPEWFKTNYPARMAYHYDQYISATGISDVLNYNSPEAKASYASYVSALCSRYKNYKCIGGWIVGNEFAYYDLWEPPNKYPNHRFLGFDTNYSRPAFQNFLSNQYGGTIAMLNSNWGTAHSSFSVIEMPTQFPVNRSDQAGTQRTGYSDVLLWRQQSIADFLSVGVSAAKLADTNHLVTYAMVGGIFSGYDDNNTCEDARAIVSVCASNGTPVDFWTVNNYPWTWTGNEMRSMNYGIAKYRETIGLPVMVSECGLSDNDVLLPETIHRQAPALASLPWEAIMSGALGAHIFHWNDRNEYYSYDNVLKREAGFGMIRASRLLKRVYWNVLDAYRRMDELHIEQLFPGAARPSADVLAYWSKETDLGAGRFNQEFAMIWPAFKRMGFQIGIIDENQFDACAFTNAKALFLPRNFQMEPQRLAALETNVLARGIHLFAEADLPGQYDFYYRSNSNWKASMASIFGLDVSEASPSFESGSMCLNYDDLHRLYITVQTNWGLLNTNFSVCSWKIWQGITNIDATVIATHRGETNKNAELPALSVKPHGAARAVFSSFAIGDTLSDGTDSSRWEFPWDVRTMMLDAVLRQTFNMQPRIVLSGDPFARYVLPDYCTCSNGSVLISLLNMSGPDHPVANLVVTAPGLLAGKKVENLTRGGVVANPAGDSVTVSIAGDEFVLLYAYDSSPVSDRSIVNTNRGKIWFVNGEATVPTRLYPSPSWQPVQVGYSIPVDWDWENIRVGLERVGPGTNRMLYGISHSNWVAPGTGALWLSLPVQNPDLADTNYISTREGGAYVITAWMEDMGEIHSRTEVPVELFWGVKPLSLPTNLQPNTAYDITLKWEDIPSYLSEEGPCPLNRADQWPLSDNDDTRQTYRVELELLNTQSNVLLSTNLVTSLGSSQHAFDLVTPAQTQSNDWWRATLAAQPINDDVIDSFEDRVPGNNKPWYTNDAPMAVWLWGNFTGVPAWWDEGIGLLPVTHGKQSDFLVLKTAVDFSYSGHTYHWSLGRTNDYSSPSVRSNIWLSCDLCVQDTNKLGTLDCSVEMQIMSADGGKLVAKTNYTNKGVFQSFKCRLSDITTPPASGSLIDWSRVNAFNISVAHSNQNVAYLFFLDNVRLTGTPIRVGTGGITNALYLSNGDRYAGPDPDRTPQIRVCNTNGSCIASGAPASPTNGTDYGIHFAGSSWTNTFSISHDGGHDLSFTGITTSGPSAALFVLSGFPSTLAPGGVGSNFVVVFNAMCSGSHEAALTFYNGASNMVVNLRGQVFNLSQTNGPAAGGALIVTNLAMNGYVMTNVVVGGLPAVIVGQGDDWIRLQLPAHDPGLVDVILQAEGMDDIRLLSAFQYNPAGQLGWIEYAPYAWTNLSSGANSTVRSLVIASDEVLYAGGLFLTLGDVTSRYVAAWNGQSWTNLGSGMNAYVNALAVGLDGRLYAGGGFGTAGGNSASRIAVWNGQGWTNLGSGMNGDVAALAVGTNGELYAGGSFTTAGGQSANYVARWNGTTWTNLGDGFNNAVQALAIGTNGELYAGGAFTSAGGQPASYMAKWDGVAWTNMGAGMNSQVRALVSASNGMLYAGGYFSAAGTVAAYYVARWNGSAWTNLGTGMNGSVDALALDTNGSVVAGGGFSSASGSAAAYIARWSGSSWTSLGLGMNNYVYALAVSRQGPVLAGGSFTLAGGVSAARYVAKWESKRLVYTGVTPTNGPFTGGTRVVLEGSHLGSGNDIAQIVICGAAVTNIIYQCATQVVVQTSAGPVGVGDVALYSTAYGMTVRSNGFNYYAPRIVVLGTNSVQLEEGDAPSAASGTDFGTRYVGQAMTNRFFLTNSSSNDLIVSGVITNTAWDPTPGLVVVANSSFEEPILTMYAYLPSGYGWSFAFPAGIAKNTFFEYPPPSGLQAGFVQNLGSLAQSIVFPDEGNYRITFDSIGRGTGANPMKLQLDGADLLSWTPVTTSWRTYTSMIYIAASGGRTLRFQGANAVGDRSSCIDNVVIQGLFTNQARSVWFRSDALPAVVAPGSTGEWVVVFNPLAKGTQELSLAVLNDATNFTMRLTGRSLFDLTPQAGATVGGHSLLITNYTLGLGTDITNVLVGGIAATIEGQGACWLKIGLPAHEPGAVDILVQSTGLGDVLLRNAYRFNSTGQIGGTAYGEMVWTALSNGLNSTVNSVHEDADGGLYAGGGFTLAGSRPANYIAAWNGLTWTNMGGGANNAVKSMILNTNGLLYVGGPFSSMSGTSALRVAQWNGSVWSNMGSGLGYSAATVNTLALGSNGDLYAGGSFTNSGGAACKNVARWTGSAWTNLGLGVSGGDVNALFFDQKNGWLYAGGLFTLAGGTTAVYIAKWNGESWTNLGSGLNNGATALTVDTNGEVYVGGAFGSAGGVLSDRVAKWDGSQWHNLDGGLNGQVYSLALDSNGFLYAGGNFTNAGRVGASGVARWDGLTWTNLGAGLQKNGSPNVFSLFFGRDGALYAGGYFTNSGAVPVNYVAKWAPAWVHHDYGVAPSNGSALGGAQVRITGRDLGGGDITNVTLAGVPVAAIVSQCSTQVVVQTAAGPVGEGDVRIYSSSFGETVKTNAFRYEAPAAHVYLAGLSQIYNGAARLVTATTDPSGLAVELTYDGQGWAPTNAGAYGVTGSVVDAVYQGWTAGTLTVQRAAQSISMTPIENQVLTNVLGLSASADSLLPVVLAVQSGPAQLDEGTNLWFTGLGMVCVMAAQEGNANWMAAPEATNLFRVYGLYTVTVVSAYGTAELSTGSYVFVEDTRLTNRVSSPDTCGWTQYVCSGWSMPGHSPAEGASTSLVMTVTNHARLTWLWLTNYFLFVAHDAQGTAAPSSGWHASGTSLTLTASASPYYRFSDWTGDVPPGQETANPLAVSMAAPRSLWAHFLANRTTNHLTPEWWMAQFGITNNFEAASANDVDGDGMPTWMEYLGDTSPIDGTAYLRMQRFDAEQVSWCGGTASVQYLEWAGSLWAPDWSILSTNRPPTLTTNTALLEGAQTGGFYRIRATRE
ncbi:MAG: hypothetical protein A2X46_08280 [Lentisphaerae bacterium GWF2_57_35]|nr:MAG: hypothetical protein A2X46_08280 [Lentisphaerae bacterium GWF2_57_35]